ncbi:hypothetical protein ACP4OV_019790 [Aristida adscensionis]
MGNVSLFAVFLCIIFAHNILGFCGFALNQGNVYGAFIEDDARLNLTGVDGSLFKITNKSSVFQQSYDKDATQLDNGAMETFYAGHAMNSQNYYGIEVTSDVYGFAIDDPEARCGIIVLLSNGKGSSENAIAVGWHRDGYQSTGCYNLKCVGYVPEPGIRTVLPGDTIDAVSDPNGVKRTIIFKVFKDNTGDWLLHVGFDSEPYLFGRFPKDLFTTLGDKVDIVALSGFVVARTTHLIPYGKWIPFR